MALTVDILSHEKAGRYMEVHSNVTFDASLVAGGESLTPGMYGLTHFKEVRISGDHDGYIVQFNYTTSELTAYQLPSLDGNVRSASGLDEADTVDLSTLTDVVRVIVVGY